MLGFLTICEKSAVVAKVVDLELIVRIYRV
jgi:hypothetical protein